MEHSPGFLRVVNDIKPLITEINIDQYLLINSEQTPFILIDVREDNEWVKGHLPNAIHIGRGVLERDIERQIPDFQTRIVLYCGGGFRSALAADMLQKLGYTQVKSLDGGFRAWCERLLPIDHGDTD